MELSSLFFLVLAIASGYGDGPESGDQLCVETPSSEDVDFCHDEAYHDHLFFTDCPFMPCRPTLGKTYTLNVHFRPSHDAVSPKVRYTVVFDFGHPNAPFLQREDPDACKYFNVTCPIRAGQPISYNHTFTLPRHRMYAMAPFKMEWQVYDPTNRQKLACLRVPFHMVY